MPIPHDVIRERCGRVSYRWGGVLYEAGLPPHTAEAALLLGMPERTLITRLRRGDCGERLRRARKRRPFHPCNEIQNRI